MKTCSNCKNQAADDAIFCPICGATLAAANAQQNPGANQTQYQAPPKPGYAPAYDPYDHTAEFDPKDISDNKVISMLVYLMGAIGIIIALLAGNTSKYAAFHVRQALKFTVIEILASICTALLAWTFIVPIAYAIFLVVLLVVKFICFFQICAGKAKEPAIIRSFGFLR